MSILFKSNRNLCYYMFNIFYYILLLIVIFLTLKLVLIIYHVYSMKVKYKVMVIYVKYLSIDFSCFHDMLLFKWAIFLKNLIMKRLDMLFVPGSERDFNM